MNSYCSRLHCRESPPVQAAHWAIAIGSGAWWACLYVRGDRGSTPSPSTLPLKLLCSWGGGGAAAERSGSGGGAAELQ